MIEESIKSVVEESSNGFDRFNESMEHFMKLTKGSMLDARPEGLANHEVSVFDRTLNDVTEALDELSSFYEN